MNTQRKLSFDDAKAEGFAEQMVGVLNGAALVLVTSIGHRTGLFCTVDQLPSTTCATLAKNANRIEHYLREWLGVMATSGVVEAAQECLAKAGFGSVQTHRRPLGRPNAHFLAHP